MTWLRGLPFDDACSRATFIDYLSGVEMLLAGAQRCWPRSSRFPTVATPDDRPVRCLGIDTLSAAGCAPRSATGLGSPSPSSCLGCWDRSSEHRSDIKRAKDRSRKLAPRPPAGYWSKTLITTATAPPSMTRSRAASTARTHI
jgi:hypothetical protein